MNTNSVSTNLSTQALQQMMGASEGRMEVERDGDRDDSAARAASIAPSPTVNFSGQKLGQVINVAA